MTCEEACSRRSVSSTKGDGTLLMINGTQLSLIKRWDFYSFAQWITELHHHHYKFPLQLQMCLVLNDTSTVITDNCERLVATFRSLLQRPTPENPIGNTYHLPYFTSLGRQSLFITLWGKRGFVGVITWFSEVMERDQLLPTKYTHPPLAKIMNGPC